MEMEVDWEGCFIIPERGYFLVIFLQLYGPVTLDYTLGDVYLSLS